MRLSKPLVCSEDHTCHHLALYTSEDHQTHCDIYSTDSANVLCEATAQVMKALSSLLVYPTAASSISTHECFNYLL